MRYALVSICAAALLGGCELREITLTAPDDIVIAEVVLRAGRSYQRAYLHRTSTGHSSARVYGARISITDVESGAHFEMDVEPDESCLVPAPDPQSASTGTCYAASGPAALILPGRTYALRIELAEGGVLTGRTTVPGDFSVLAPAGLPSACVLPPDTVMELVWSGSSGAAVYITEATMSGLREALRARGQEVPGAGPVELLGLSITAQDTTLLFPSELGLFDRFDEDLHPILLAIRGGLPPDVYASMSVTATDRNYVNWARGGTFNPSGQIRVSSLRGDGAGVFGATVTRSFDLITDSGGTPSGLPPCR